MKYNKKNNNIIEKKEEHIYSIPINEENDQLIGYQVVIYQIPKENIIFFVNLN